MLTYFKLFFTIPKVINTIDFGIIATRLLLESLRLKMQIKKALELFLVLSYCPPSIN